MSQSDEPRIRDVQVSHRFEDAALTIAHAAPHATSTAVKTSWRHMRVVWV